MEPQRRCLALRGSFNSVPRLQAMRLLHLHHFFFSFFTCDPSLPWAVLIFLAVPPSQAVNFQRLRVKPRRRLREGDLSYGMDGHVETAAAIETQALIGIDRATHLREQQSGAFTGGGNNNGVHGRGCSSRLLLRYNEANTGSVCLAWGEPVRRRYHTILRFHDMALPDVSVTL